MAVWGFLFVAVCVGGGGDSCLWLCVDYCVYLQSIFDIHVCRYSMFVCFVHMYIRTYLCTI